MIKRKIKILATIICIILVMLASFWGIYQWRAPIHAARNILNGLYDDYAMLDEILGSGFVQLGDAVYDENGTEYYEVIEEGYESTEQLRNLISKVYTESYKQKLLSIYFEGERPIIKDTYIHLKKEDGIWKIDDIS